MNNLFDKLEDVLFGVIECPHWSIKEGTPPDDAPSNDPPNPPVLLLPSGLEG